MTDRNWIAQTTTTTGTVSTLALDGNIPGFRSFGSGGFYGDGDQVIYSITDGINREIGIGTYITTPSLAIVRGTILATLVAGVYDGNSPSILDIQGGAASPATISISDSTQALTLTHPVYKREMLTLNAEGYASPTPANMLGGTGVKAYEFLTAPGSTEELGFTYVAGHDVKAGSSIIPSIMVAGKAVPAVSADTAVWVMEYTIATLGSAFTGSTVETVSQLIPATILQSGLVEMPSIAIASPDVVVTGRIYRSTGDAADNYANSVYVTGMQIKYLSDLIGTPGKSTPYTDW